MTQPDPEELVPDEETVAYEVSAVAEVTAGLGAALAPILGQILATWSAGTTGAVLTAAIVKALSAAPLPRMNARLRKVAQGAVELGVERAVRPLDPADTRKAQWTQPPELKVPNLDRATRSRVAEAQDLARTLALETKRDVDAVLGRISAVRSRAEGTVRWSANEGINAGVAAVAERLDQGLIWVAERDACLHCLAYAGWSVAAGDTFPPGLTFGDKPLERDGMLYPPLHPGCRCQVRVYEGPFGAPPGDRSRVDLAARVAAEARRSVVYGWTAHASHAATLRAMDRLLRHGAGLPVSVERRARDLVRMGQTQPQPR